jgi:hypothetical protein
MTQAKEQKIRIGMRDVEDCVQVETNACSDERIAEKFIGTSGENSPAPKIKMVEFTQSNHKEKEVSPLS